ncbi:MAG: ATP-binding protein [Bdellovibrionota bacterium]
MDNQRNLYDIFSSIQAIAESRNLLEKPKTNQLKCLCGSDSDVDAREESDINKEKLLEAEGIYIENTPRGSRFALCPACDLRNSCMCGGTTGYILYDRAYVVETKEGKMKYKSEDISPNSCSCMRPQILVHKLNKAGIPDKYIHADFNSFHFNHIKEAHIKEKLSKNIEKVSQFCAKLVQEIKQHQKKYFVTLFGPVGSGKTLLATAALKMLITNENMSGKFVDFQYLLSELRSEYDDHKTGENILNELRHVDVLLIDEFGKGRNDKEWQLEKLDDLVNYRYNAQKTTFITTNYLPQNLKYQDKEIPYTRNKDIYSHDTPINETFWQQSLSERIGMRMYERILEVSEFIDFTNLPSYRKFLGRDFLEMYSHS